MSFCIGWGTSPAVAGKHYLRVRDIDFEKAAHFKAQPGAGSVQKPAAIIPFRSNISGAFCLGFPASSCDFTALLIELLAAWYTRLRSAGTCSVDASSPVRLFPHYESVAMPVHTADAVIVGAGACGSLVAKVLAEQGWDVVVLEAGRRLDPATDLANSEANGGKIMWTEPRVYAGKHGVVPKTGVGVGGGTLVWLGVMPRFHPADFRTYSTEGVGADWPIGLRRLAAALRRVEREFGVAGECGPFAPEPYRLPHAAASHELARAALGPRRDEAGGARRSRRRWRSTPIPYDGRPACIYCGWCGSGCPDGGEGDRVADVLAAGRARSAPRSSARRSCIALTYDATHGRVTGVEYVDADGPRACREREAWSSSPPMRSRRRGCCCCRPTAPSPRASPIPAAWSAGPDEPSDVAGVRQVRRARERVQGHADGPRDGSGLLQARTRATTMPAGIVLISYMMTPITYANLSGGGVRAELKQFLHDYPVHGRVVGARRGAADRDEHRDARSRRERRARAAGRASHLRVGRQRLALAGAARDKAAEMMAASGARAGAHRTELRRPRDGELPHGRRSAVLRS